ncbi:MAG: hypothetical protein LBT84_00800 [Spirochaetia bacterium]|jgi:general secretion pathway protein D|nr:hypothetical protein [Spirochaetia bacterium]
MKNSRLPAICILILLSLLLSRPVVDPLYAQQKTAAKKQPTKQEQTFALNFKDIDISEFLSIMSQLIGKNIILDDKVTGKISIHSAKRLPVSQAYDIMKSILSIKGLAVVEANGILKILPIQDAAKSGIEVIIDGRSELISPKKEETLTLLLELKYADAEEVAKALRALKSKNTEIVVYQPLNTIIVSGISSEINGLVKISETLDKQIQENEALIQSKGNIHVVHLQNANSTQLAEVLSRVPFSETAVIETAPMNPEQQQQQQRQSNQARRTTQNQAAAPKKTNKLSIIPNKETNSLIIAATPEEFREIIAVVKELDIVREQVLIEALIVEVKAENGWGFGINWMLGNQSGQNQYGGSYTDRIPNFTNSTIAGKKVALPLDTGFQLGYLPDTSILAFVVLNASGTENDFNILSTPQLLTVDNEEAELNVGEEIPIASNNRISESGTQFYTYEYKSVGIKLKITPHITNTDRITLDLYQEINSVIGTTQVLEGNTIPPTLGKRDIKTKVSVPEGKTIVVGGLIQNTRNENVTKVPILGDIPLLGWFFKNKTAGYSKTNLLVFITPHIVTKEERLEEITKQKIESQRRIKR